MTENSGNIPSDPHIVPAQPGHEPLPGLNGPVDRFPLPDPIPAPNLQRAGADETKTPEQKDSFRETVETVVFVVVLVLLLKAFMAEAFVIPTGSMATTLYGYNRIVECPQCGFRFPLNMSEEKDFQANQQPLQNPPRIMGCTCPNCRLVINGTNSPQFPPPQNPN